MDIYGTVVGEVHIHRATAAHGVRGVNDLNARFHRMGSCQTDVPTLIHYHFVATLGHRPCGFNALVVKGERCAGASARATSI